MGYIPALKNYQNSKNYNIYFTHVPTNNEVSFPAIIKNFQDQFSSTHSPTEVYGRMDPIYNFQRTIRKITCAFDCIAASRSEAYENLANMSKLITFLYPTYKKADEASTISSPPLFRIKLMNLMQSAKPAAGSDNNNTGNIGNGLLGFVDGFTYNPAFGEMTFVDEHDFITPISFPVQFSFNVVHEHNLGWEDGSFGKEGLFGGDIAFKEELARLPFTPEERAALERRRRAGDEINLRRELARLEAEVTDGANFNE